MQYLVDLDLFRIKHPYTGCNILLIVRMKTHPRLLVFFPFMKKASLPATYSFSVILSAELYTLQRISVN